MSQDQTARECAVIIGSYTNACSIISSLKQIKYPGKIIAIDPTVDKAKCLAEVVFPEMKVIKRKVKNLDDICEMINGTVSTEVKKIVFMTSEEFIEPVRKAIEDGRLQNTVAHTGSGLDNDLIFDRFMFYRFVEGVGINNVPRTIPSYEDPYKEFGTDFIVRVNKSWEGNKKLPRLRIVHSKEEKESVEKQFIDDGLTPDMWCYQELLSTVDTHNVSVCGWYDREFHQYAVTRKILQHPPKIGNGDVVEIFHDAPESLVSQTETILKGLEYTGAFEMEFVLDSNSGEYKLIELNPRFWMQHGLIEKVTNSALIRRAVGENGLSETEPKNLDHLYWVNGTQAIYRLLKGQISILRYLKTGVCVPTISQAFKWGFYYRKYVDECG